MQKTNFTYVMYKCAKNTPRSRAYIIIIMGVQKCLGERNQKCWMTFWKLFRTQKEVGCRKEHMYCIAETSVSEERYTFFLMGMQGESWQSVCTMTVTLKCQCIPRRLKTLNPFNIYIHFKFMADCAKVVKTAAEHWSEKMNFLPYQRNSKKKMLCSQEYRTLF